jgi:uncharacterized protein
MLAAPRDLTSECMKLDREQGSGHLVAGFRDGVVLVGTQRLPVPLIVTAERIITDWLPPPAQSLEPVDLQAILDLDPEVILLGTGEQQRFPPAVTLAAVLQRGIGIEVMNSAAACRTYNVLASELRQVALALI